jgi:hypothetical protein
MTEPNDDELLKKLKDRLHIFHSIEDDNLKDMINASKQSVFEMTGVDDLANDNYVELILERCRYIYNDSLEYFDANFQANLLGLSFANYSKDGDSNELPTTKD